jgi:polysaccharide export outer membrane protein
MMRKILFVVAAIAMAAASAMPQSRPSNQLGQIAGQAQQTPPAGPMGEATIDEFVIGPGDVLQIAVWREPELTTKGSVRPDGKIGIPLLGDTQASGLATGQLQERIAEGLSKFVAEPQVTVIVAEIHSQQVHVIGSVAKPGMYPLVRPLTIVEVLARAGGLVDFAKTKEIRVVRPMNGSSRQFPFNYDDFAAGRDFQQNIQLRSGDIVVVP